MSVWKKASKVHQKTPQERHQPALRQHLGILEKKTDYTRRATDYNEKRDTLKLLRKRALNKNPDEFYHHMVNAKVEDGRHFDKETEPEDSAEQKQLMLSQDIKYINMKRVQEKKKIESLQAQLHLTSVGQQPVNKHIRFGKRKSEGTKQEAVILLNALSEKELEDIDLEELKAASQVKRKRYQELTKRIVREKELNVVQQKFELNKNLERKTQIKPKRIKKATKNRAAVYMWTYERKK